MSTSPFPYTCELCGAEGLTDEGMRVHTLEAHVNGRPECPFCDAVVPQAQLVGHVQRAHLHYLTPERELMAFIDDQSPRHPAENQSFDDDSKMSTTDSCSFYTPGSLNGWHSLEVPSSSSFQNGAISKNNLNYQQNGDRDRESRKDYREKDEERISRSSKNINLSNGLKNINVSNGVIPKNKNRSRESSQEGEINGHQRKYAQTSNSPKHNGQTNYDGSPGKNKMGMASAGRGSPLRSQLALKLKPNTPKKSLPNPSPTVQCLLCDYTSTCPKKLEEHINRAHFDLTSPSVLANSNANSNANVTTTTTTTTDNPTLGLTSAMALNPEPGTSTFQCPLCEMEFRNVNDVEIHVNVDHKDILSPQKMDQCMDNASSNEDVIMIPEGPVETCPVCGKSLPQSQQEVLEHIEDHFERSEEGYEAAGLSAAERQAMKNREEHEFQLLRAQYGMEEDDDEGYTSRTTNSLKRAVYSGALSVAGYYERSVGLRRAAAAGKDPGASRTTGLIEKIEQLNLQNPDIVRTYLCSEVDHYASTYGDRGWGCGYRNMQMLLSSLLRHPQYGELLAAGLSPPGGPADGPAGGAAPSIPQLQLLAERAWDMGFDTQGSEQLGCKLYNTRKWIGACEVVTVLSSLRIKCKLVDFHKPSSPDGGHPALFAWVLRYFQQPGPGPGPGGFKPPLYLQHQGHSRTIIGYEKHRDGKATLLVLDPSHSPAQVRQAAWGGGGAGLRLLRRGAGALRARQYQLASVQGALDSPEYEASKVLQSERIP